MIGNKEPELTPEEDIVIDELIERAKRWDISDNGLYNTISRVVKDEEEKRIIDKMEVWSNEQNALSYAKERETVGYKREEAERDRKQDIETQLRYAEIQRCLASGERYSEPRAPSIMEQLLEEEEEGE